MSSLIRHFKYLFLLLTFTFSVTAFAQSLENVATTKSLLTWMEKNLNKKANFSVQDLQRFFANKFTINSNGKIVTASPATYHQYLYEFKNRITSVKYDVQQYIRANDYVITPFIIHIKTADKKSNQNLRVIAIFKFDKNGKIISWQEVFTPIKN